MSKRNGFVDILERSAAVLEREAKVLKASYTTPAGKWDIADARRDFDDMTALAKALRRSAKYHQPNPLGGPAKVFDAIADAVRAGDSLASAMANHGVQWVPKKK
jgi:hypothetical protein